MEAGTIITGLGAFGFWIFIAAVVVAGMWYDLRNKQSQQETIREIIKKGKAIDKDEIETIMNTAKDDSKLYKELKLSALIMIFIALGMALMGIAISMAKPSALLPLLGVSLLMVCISLGLFAAAKFINKDRQ